jgi:hypothetical protein
MLAQCNNNNKIISPASDKPTETSITSLNCNALTIRWKGNTNEDYELTAIIKDAATGKTIQTKTINSYKFDGLNYTANIPVIAGEKISWSIRGITAEDNRVFYSYPLRGKEVTVPACPSPPVADNAKKDNSLAVVNNKSKLVKIYPNPFQSILNIDFAETNKIQKSISIYDINGKLLLTKSADCNTQLDVKQLTAGTYLIKINDQNGKELYSGKVIKQ